MMDVLLSHVACTMLSRESLKLHVCIFLVGQKDFHRSIDYMIGDRVAKL